MRWVFALVLSLAPSLFGQAIPFPGPGGKASGAATGPSAFTYVASSVTACYSFSSTTACAYNLHTNPTAGNLGIVSITWASTTATASFSCSNNTTWTAIGSPKVGTGANAGISGQMFRIFSMVGGASPELCTSTISSAVNFQSWEYVAYSYSGTLSSLDGTPQYSNTAASGGIATISGLTTSNSSDLVFSACLAVASACTVGSGYTLRDDTNACNSTGSALSCGAGGTTGNDYGSVTGQIVEEKVNVGPGAQTATFGTGTTDDVILGLVAF